MSRQRSSHSRRGRWWEDYLSPLHDRYALERRAFIQKNHPSFKITGQQGARFSGVWDGQGQPDYTGMANGWAWYAEAKETKGHLWQYKDLRGHQAEQFDAALTQGLGALLLIRETDKQRAHVLPWMHVREAWWAWDLAQRTPGNASPGTASITFAAIEDLSIYTAPTTPEAFDYLDALLAWRHGRRDLDAGTRAQLLSEPVRRARKKRRRGGRR